MASGHSLCDCQLLKLGNQADISVWNHRQQPTILQRVKVSGSKSQPMVSSSWRTSRPSNGQATNNSYQFCHHTNIENYMKDYNRAFLKCGVHHVAEHPNFRIPEANYQR